MLIYDIVLKLLFWLLLTLFLSGIGRVLYMAVKEEKAKNIMDER